MNEWDLSRIIKDEKDFENKLVRLKDITAKMAGYKSKLGKEDKLKEYLDLSLEMNDLITSLYMFSSMRSDLNKKDVKNSAALAKVMNAYQNVIAATSFENPESLSLGKDYFDKFLAKNPKYAQFKFGYEKLFRSAEHILSGDQERLISNFAPVTNEGSSLYSTLTVADLVPGEVELTDGTKVKVTQSNWTNLIADAKSAEDRKRIFQTLYKYYDKHKNTYGEIYNLVLQSQIAEMKARKYNSIVEMHLFGNNIPTSVYETLVDVAGSNTEYVKKYYEIKRKYLGLDKIRSYDRFVKLAKSDKKYTYDEGKNMFFDSLKNFPSDFQSKAREVLKEGYVDVYPKDGKRTGAYSNGGEGIHPYILFNFDNSLEDCFTLAHESGHSMHTLYSMENQPTLLQGYTIFVAEIASTFNEHNLLDYLMNSGKLEKNEKILLLQKAIDSIMATFYRQTLFGEYELIMSRKAEKQEPINYQVCNQVMVDLYQKYYGIDIREEVYKPLVWAYIPHLFYSPMYVYQYATSFSASMKIYQDVKNGVPNAFERYIGLLKSGGSKYPVDQAKEAGVDFTKRETFEAVSNRLKELVLQLEDLLK
ncbi:MAG: oligoendopeptidase F [Bacilli bacterium]